MFEATFELLWEHKCPDWFRDSKKCSGIQNSGAFESRKTLSPSSIQTILSASEFHRIMQTATQPLAGYTAGGELHPALKSV